MSIDLFSTFPKFVDEELRRRKDRNNLQDPKTPWMRMSSGFKPEDGKRRVLMGGDLSIDQKLKFGFEGLYDEQSSTGEKYRPVPAIESVNVDEKLESLEATIEWTAFSIDQLEELFPFFMNLGTTIIVDFGWSDVPANAVIDVSDPEQFRRPFQQLDPESEQKVESANSEISPAVASRYKHPKYEVLSKGDGRYSFIHGFISNFSYSPDGNGKYSCTTEIMSVSKALTKISSQNQEYNRDESEPKGKNQTPKKSLPRWMAQDYENHLKTFSQSGGGGGRPGDVVKVQGGKDLNRREDLKHENTYYISWREIEHIVNQKISLKSKPKIRNIELNSAGSVISSYDASQGGNPPIQLRSRDPLVCVVDVGGQSDLFRDFHVSKMQAGPADYPAIPFDWFNDGFSIDKKTQGLLYNLYIEYQVFENALKKHDTVFKALKYILDMCSQACFNIWDFEFIIDSNSVQVVDRNMVAKNDVNSVLNAEEKEHVFRPNTRQTVLRDFNFDTNLADMIKAQILFQNRSSIENEKDPAVNFRDDSVAKFFKRSFPGKDIVLGDGKKLSHAGIEESKTEKESIETGKNAGGTAVIDVTSEEAWYEKSNVFGDISWEDMRRRQQKTIRSLGEKSKYLFYKGSLDGSSQAAAFSRRLQASSEQFSPVNANNIVNIDAQLTFAGIGGFSAFQVLKIKNIPRVFNNVGVFTVDSVSHNVSIDDWTTELKTSFVVENTVSETSKFEKPLRIQDDDSSGSFSGGLSGVL